MFTLDQYVDMDYSLVYFHHGLTSNNKPPLSWLWGLYKVRAQLLGSGSGHVRTLLEIFHRIRALGMKSLKGV